MASDSFPVRSFDIEARNSLETPGFAESTKKQRIKRILFIGPTGVGKSTLINILFNDSVNKLSLLKPAVTSAGSAGSTTNFTTYYCFPDYAFTDSIGFGDNRFEIQDIMSQLNNIIKNSLVGYNKVFLCISYGRISNDIRYYIDLLMVVFGKKILTWCTIVLTHCTDQKMTKEKYIEMNKNDEYLIHVISSVQGIVFGDNMVDDDDDMENILIKRRQHLLDCLKEDIRNAKTEYYMPQPISFTEWILAIYNMIVSTFVNEMKSSFAEISTISDAVKDMITHKNFADYYGQCSICLDDMWNKDSVFTKCDHIFHKRCIKKWLAQDVNGSSCPMCRRFLDAKDSFLTPLDAGLTAEEEVDLSF